MKAPRASFVIPVKNGQKYLPEALSSCMAQSIKEIEIIVVNDGSSDGTRELLDFYVTEDKRIIPIHLEENVGRSKARNIGNAKVSSPFIFVLDADDRACKHRVRDTLITFNMKNPDLVYGPFFQIDELGQLIQKVGAGPFNKEISKLRKFNYICHSTMAYRTGVTKNVQYDEGPFSDLGLDDWKFQWEAHSRGYKFEVCKQLLSYWRQSSDGISSNRDEQAVAKLKEEFLATI